MTIKQWLGIFPDAWKEFNHNDPLRLGSSVAFFAIFAIPAILFIMVHLFGIIFSEKIVSGELLGEIEYAFGEETAKHLAVIFENLQNKTQNVWRTFAGLVFFGFVATTFFSVILRSLNQLWGIRTKKKGMFLKKLKSRGKSLALIIFSGIIFIFSIFLDWLVIFLGDWITEVIPFISIKPFTLISQLISLAIVGFWFAILYKYLPDAKIHWKAALVGGGITAILIVTGKFLLNLILTRSDIGNIYGAWSSVVLVLLFIFYSSLILFYGAAVTKSYAHAANMQIEPKEYASRYPLSIQEE